MQFAQICDLVETDAAGAAPPDVSAMLGTWLNSNPETSGIARMVMSEEGGKLWLRVSAVGPEGLIDWGAAEVSVFSSSATARDAAGFTCLYDFGFAETRLQAMILKGLIVLAQIHAFKDGSGRVDYFVREYFALAHGRY
ncbi:MAG: hypothetical protein M3416_04135 [Acidobacteriota bacterium]|nr:hypothetical protein [Acidobacteriota bacterium]